MPRPRRGEEDRYSPTTESDSFKQSLYGELTTPEALEEALKAKEEEEKKKNKKNIYFKLCELTENHFVKKRSLKYGAPEKIEADQKKKKKKELPREYKEALGFLGWKLDPDVVLAVPKIAGIIGLFIGIFISFTLFMILEPNDAFLLLVILFIPIFLTLGLINYIQKYPLKAADAEKLRALTYVPEILNYLVMQMRLQPNLERAVEFASEHGEGRIADEFKELLWKNRVGIYDSIEEGLDDMAYRWEPYSEEFKHSITMIRASVLVPNDIERGVLYDTALDDVLSSTKEKMELYTHSMKQPSMYLFYIAVLLPLMVIIMLPVAAAFAGLPIASTPILAALYIFIMPLITYIYAKSVLSKRPGGYIPPEIPDDHPDLPPKGTAVIKGMKLPVLATTIIILITIVGVGWFLDSSIKYSEAELTKLNALSPDKEIGQPYIIQYFIPLAIGIPLGFYLFGKNVNKRQIQEKIFKMELDFKDVMYLLASRLGEKKPMEDAIGYVKKFMPESKVATELLENVQRNIMVMGLTLRSAIFDPLYGAMKNTPSRLMKSSFKIMVDSIDLGPEVASNSLISVSNQIRNVQKINELMRKLLDDVTGMMSSMATFISPIVLGIVASLQQVIIAVIRPLSAQTSSATELGSEAAQRTIEGAQSTLGSGMIDASAIEHMAGPIEFQLIVAIYVIELVIILSYFAGKVKYGDNKAAIMLNIGKTLPIAIAIFVGALFAGGSMIGGLAG
jgi:hypothetical protein